MISILKKPLRFVQFSLQFIVGYAQHLLFNKTSPWAYQSMVGLFCLTRGKSNDIAHRIAMIGKKPYSMDAPNGVLGKMDAPTIDRVVADIRDKGYHVFDQKLPEDVCRRMLDFSLEHEAKVRVCAANLKKGVGPTFTKLDRSNPQGVRYDFDETTSLSCPDIQKLISDPTLLAVAQSYLHCKPIMDIVAFWWHAKYGDEPDSEAAQFYHFDMDRIKWLKFFFYITDVKSENGPHCFIAKSHRTGGIPHVLLKKGYQRLKDEEVAAQFPDKLDFIEFSGPRGTIIAEDTRGLHKGKHVEKGDRLIFQIEFCDSLFGALLFDQGKLPAHIVPELATALRKYPRVYSKFKVP